MKYILILISVLYYNCNNVFAAEANNCEEGLPQLNPHTFVEQIFWFLIIFLLLFIYISRYVTPKIRSIQTSRERLIQQNLFASKKNMTEAAKIRKIINLQLHEAQESSKHYIAKITHDLLQIEERRIAEIKLKNDKIKAREDSNTAAISQEFINNYKTNLTDTITIILTKLNVPLSREIISKELNNTKI